MMLLVSSGYPKRKRRIVSELPYILLTVGPWVVLLWLLWPRR